MYEGLIFVGFIVFIVLSLWVAWWASPSGKGKIGEIKVQRKLSYLSPEYKVLNNVVLSTSRGTTQIDHLVVSKYGIFVVETKNYRGDIYGDDNRKEWTQIIVTKVRYNKKWWKEYTYVTKNNLYNPVKQALMHLYEVKKHLEEFPRVRIIPIVAFNDEANLANVSSNSHVIHISELANTIKQYDRAYMTDSDVQRIEEILNLKNLSEVVSKHEHVKNISKAKSQYENKIAKGICPKCGGELVKRSGQYGSFYGCSNYPTCKFTVK